MSMSSADPRPTSPISSGCVGWTGPAFGYFPCPARRSEAPAHPPSPIESSANAATRAYLRSTATWLAGTGTNTSTLKQFSRQLIFRHPSSLLQVRPSSHLCAELFEVSPVQLELGSDCRTDGLFFVVSEIRVAV